MPTKETTSFTSLFKRSTLAAVLLLLGGGELALRVTTFGWDALVHWGRYSPVPLQETDLVVPFPDPKLGWRLLPKLTSFYKGKPFSTNSEGFRDRERSVLATAGQSRIAVLGRSYEMGTGVSDLDTWPAQLERDFFLGSTEVLNFGVEAYSWIQVEATFHRFAKNYRPTCVLLPIFYEEIDSLVPVEAAPLPSAGDAGLAFSGWTDHWYGPHFLQQEFWWLLFRHSSSDWAYLPAPSDRKPEHTVGAEPFATVTQRLVGEIEKAGMSVVVIPMPRLMRTSATLYAKGRRLLELYGHSQKNVTVLKSVESLHEGLTPSDLATPGDPHFNGAFNHKLAALVFADLQNVAGCH